jgi:prophage maintenance system killer protein
MSFKGISMIMTARKIVQIHRVIRRELGLPFVMISSGTIQILEWSIEQVEVIQKHHDSYPCIFAEGAQLFYFITSIRPFRKYNLLTALCATDWWLRRQGFELTTLVDDDLQAVIERVIRGYRMPTVWECEQFSQEFRYWFFMHSQPTSGQPEGAISVIKAMSRTLKTVDW